MPLYANPKNNDRSNIRQIPLFTNCLVNTFLAENLDIQPDTPQAAAILVSLRAIFHSSTAPLLPPKEFDETCFPSDEFMMLFGLSETLQFTSSIAVNQYRPCRLRFLDFLINSRYAKRTLKTLKVFGMTEFWCLEKAQGHFRIE